MKGTNYSDKCSCLSALELDVRSLFCGLEWYPLISISWNEVSKCLIVETSDEWDYGRNKNKLQYLSHCTDLGYRLVRIIAEFEPFHLAFH